MAENTVEMRVNVGVASWQEPNPVAGQPPIQRSAFRGEVVAFPAYYVEEKRNEKVLVHYPPVPGSTERLARYEPVLVSPNAGDDEIASRAAADAEIVELQAKLDALRLHRPPSLPAFPPLGSVQGTEVVVSPTVSGIRLLATPGDDSGTIPGLTAGATLPAPTPPTTTLEAGMGTTTKTRR